MPLNEPAVAAAAEVQIRWHVGVRGGLAKHACMAFVMERAHLPAWTPRSRSPVPPEFRRLHDIEGTHNALRLGICESDLPGPRNVERARAVALSTLHR